jgi:hypothetical protein
MNKHKYIFDENPRVKMKPENIHAMQLDKSSFLKMYGELLFQKYSIYCRKLSDGPYDSFIPYMKVIFSKRHSSLKKIVNEHIIEHDVIVSEVKKEKIHLNITKTVTTGEMTSTHINRPGKSKRVTKKIDSVSDISVTKSVHESEREIIIECVPVARLDQVIYCDMNFQDSSEDIGCQTDPHWVTSKEGGKSPSSLSNTKPSVLNILPESHDLKLESVMVNSIGIQSVDSYIHIDEPKKPMYRHLRNKMGLGKLAERNETIREIWMTQEILSLKSQLKELIESQDSLIMSGRLLDAAPSVSNEVDVINMESIMAQVATLTDDPVINEVTKKYFG